MYSLTQNLILIPKIYRTLEQTSHLCFSSIPWNTTRILLLGSCLVVTISPLSSMVLLISLTSSRLVRCFWVIVSIPGAITSSLARRAGMVWIYWLSGLPPTKGLSLLLRVFIYKAEAVDCLAMPLTRSVRLLTCILSSWMSFDISNMSWLVLLKAVFFICFHISLVLSGQLVLYTKVSMVCIVLIRLTVVAEDPWKGLVFLPGCVKG